MTRDDYLIAHIREAMAASPKVGTLDITVEVSGHTVYLSGMVDCESKRDAAIHVARNCAPEYDIVNHLTTLRLTPVDPPEILYDSPGSHR